MAAAYTAGVAIALRHELGPSFKTMKELYVVKIWLSRLKLSWDKELYNEKGIINIKYLK